MIGSDRVPDVMGRPASTEEFLSVVFRKRELVDGHIPEKERLVLLLLATMGLRRVEEIVECSQLAFVHSVTASVAQGFAAVEAVSPCS